MSCNNEERLVQNIYIHSSNRNYKGINLSMYNYNNNYNINLEMDWL